MPELEKYYQYLKSKGADVAPTFQSFRNTLSDDKSARTYFDYLKKNKFDIPDTYESFANTLGIKKKESGLSVGTDGSLRSTSQLQERIEKPFSFDQFTPQELKKHPEYKEPVSEDYTEDKKGSSLVGGTALLKGFASVASSTLKSIGIAAKRIDLFNEYGEKKAEDLATYKAGQWIDDKVKDLAGELSPEEQDKFSVKLAQGVGQMGGFVLGGWGGRVLKVSPLLTTAGLGAAVGGASEYEAAIQSGATEDQAAKAFWLNGLIGTTEALPIMSAFRKLDKYTGGLATGVLAKKLSSTIAGRLTNEVAQGFVIEAAQEAAQQLLTNVVASNTYDVTRSIYDGLLESAAIGGIIGGSMNGIASSIRERRNAGGLTKEEDNQLAITQKFAEEKANEALNPDKKEVTTDTPKNKKVKEITKAKIDLEADLASSNLPEETKTVMQSEVAILDQQLEEAKTQAYQQDLDSKTAEIFRSEISENEALLADDTLTESTKAVIQKSIEADKEKLAQITQPIELNTEVAEKKVGEGILAGVDAKFIAEQAQNVQADGSVSNLQSAESAYNTAVKSFGKEKVDAAIKAHPLESLVKQEKVGKNIPSESEIEKHINDMEDDKEYTAYVHDVNEIPEQFRDRATKVSGEIKTRKSFFGIPYGKETTTNTFRYTFTGKEAKDEFKKQKPQPKADVPIEGKKSAKDLYLAKKKELISKYGESAKGEPNLEYTDTDTAQKNNDRKVFRKLETEYDEVKSIEDAEAYTYEDVADKQLKEGIADIALNYSGDKADLIKVKKMAAELSSRGKEFSIKKDILEYWKDNGASSETLKEVADNVLKLDNDSKQISQPTPIEGKKPDVVVDKKAETSETEKSKPLDTVPSIEKRRDKINNELNNFSKTNPDFIKYKNESNDAYEKRKEVFKKRLQAIRKGQDSSDYDKQYEALSEKGDIAYDESMKLLNEEHERLKNKYALPTKEQEDEEGSDTTKMPKEPDVGKQKEKTDFHKKVDDVADSLIKEKGKILADKIRKLKTKHDKLQTNIFGIPIAIYDGLIESIATAVEAGATLAEAIQNIIKDIRDTHAGFQEKDFIKHLEDSASEIGITHAETAELRKEAGIEEYEKTPQTVAQWIVEADKRIANGEMPAILDKIRNLDDIGDVGQIMMGKYIATLAGKVKKNPSTENLNEYKNAIELSDLAGSSWGREGRARQERFMPEESVAKWLVDRMESSGVDELTDKQKEDITKQFEAYEAALKVEQEQRAKLEEEVSALKAELAIKTELGKRKAVRAKDRESLDKERKQIINDIKDKLKKSRGETSVTGIPYAKDLITIAPDVAKLVRNLIETGTSKLSDIVDTLHENLKDEIKGITKKDINDLIAGEYNEPPKTRNELALQLKDVQDQAKLVTALEKLQNDDRPYSEQAKIKRNKEITELRGKIKDFKKENPDVNQQLKAIKALNISQAKKIRDDIINKRYVKQKPKPFDYNAAIKKADPKLWKETMDAIILKNELKDIHELNKQRDEWKKRSKGRKVLDVASKIIATSKAIKAGIDDSVTFIQLGMAILANPIAGVQAKWEAIKDINNVRFKRNLVALHNSPRWPLIEKSGLDITEPRSLHKNLIEELFSDNLLNQNFTIKDKKINVWTYTGGIFERLFTSMGNNLRLILFLKRVEQLENNGMTFETHEQEFKDAARVLNELTARGRLPQKIQALSPYITPIIWAPRMLASSFNLLGISDIARGAWGKGYYQNLTPAQRSFAFQQIGDGIGAGLGIMAIALLTGWDVDFEPESVTFGTIGRGTTRYNVFGRFSGVVKVFVQSTTGTRKTRTGEQDLDNHKFGGKTVGSVAGSFVRGKMTPFAGVVFDWKFNAGKNSFTREEITPSTLPNELLTPISINDMKKGLEQDGAWSLLTRFLPAFEGINVSDERDFKKFNSTGGGLKLKMPKLAPMKLKLSN